VSAWKTQKGDEWIYDNGSVKSGADYNSEINYLLIKYISFPRKKASEKLLLNFLSDTKSFFPEGRIFIESQKLDKESGATLSSLQNKKLIILNTPDLAPSHREILSLKNKKCWFPW
jgi:hypothetical protein